MYMTEKREFYERVYFHELNKQAQIYEKLRLPIAILILIVPVHFFAISEIWNNIKSVIDISDLYNKIMSDLFTVIVLPSLAVITIAILFFLVRFIYKALTTWTYYEASLEEFNEYYDRLINYYREYSNENQDPQKLELLVVETFEKDLTEQLMKCENHNREVNMARNAYIKYFMQTLPLYIVSVALLALPNF